MTRATARIPQIVEAEIQGKTQIQIAEDLGVSRMQIYKDRQTPLYEVLVNEFFQLYKDTIKELINSEQITVKQEALKELGRMYRAGMTKRVHTQEEHTLTANINITENRKQKEDLVKSLELTPDQYRVLEDSVKDEKK